MIKWKATLPRAIIMVFLSWSGTALAFDQSDIPIPDAQKTICDPINRELVGTGQRFRSAYERGTLKFFKTHGGHWQEQPSSAGRQILLDIMQANTRPNLNVRTAAQREMFADKKIRERKLIYSTMSASLPGMTGRFNVARIGLPTTSLAGRVTEYRYLVSAGKLAASKMDPNFLTSFYRSLVVRGFFYLVNDDGNVVSPYFVLNDGGMLEKPVKWGVLPECQIDIEHL